MTHPNGLMGEAAAPFVRPFILTCVIVLIVGIVSYASGDAGLPGMADGPMKKETRTLPPYHAVSVRGSLTVHWLPGESTSAVVKAQENVLPHIRTEVEDGKLKVYCDKTFFMRQAAVVDITAPALDDVALAGSGDVTVRGMTGDNLHASVTGSGDVTVRNITGAAMDGSVAGSGDLTLAGDIEKLSVSVTGSGDLRGADLKAKSVDVSVTGSGDASVYASEHLNGSVTGSGTVAYAGNPKDVSQKVIGSGEVVSK